MNIPDACNKIISVRDGQTKVKIRGLDDKLCFL